MPTNGSSRSSRIWSGRSLTSSASTASPTRSTASPRIWSSPRSRPARAACSSTSSWRPLRPTWATTAATAASRRSRARSTCRARLGSTARPTCCPSARRRGRHPLMFRGRGHQREGRAAGRGRAGPVARRRRRPVLADPPGYPRLEPTRPVPHRRPGSLRGPHDRAAAVRDPEGRPDRHRPERARPALLPAGPPAPQAAARVLRRADLPAVLRGRRVPRQRRGQRGPGRARDRRGARRGPGTDRAARPATALHRRPLRLRVRAVRGVPGCLSDLPGNSSAANCPDRRGPDPAARHPAGQAAQVLGRDHGHPRRPADPAR